MKIALVHDYLREYGGAERVVEVFHQIWPEAPLYTAFVDWKALGKHAKRFKNWDIRPSWVQSNWLVKKFHSPLRFLAPLVWNSIDLREYDVVLSSSGWYMCRGVQTGKESTEDNNSSKRQNNATSSSYKKLPVHFCYIHHPPRNLYGYETGGLVEKYWLVKIYAMIINFFLRQYDFDSAQKVDYFIANSQETARRVKKFYRRESTVIYPPIETSTQDMDHQSPEYYLSVGRLTASKRIDVLIEACNQLKLPLKIVGTGRELSLLQSIAGPTIEFLGSKTDQEIEILYQKTKALLFCARNEDFGMVPVEAMAHGVPVIALAEGGVKETIIDGVTGLFFHAPETQSLVKVIQKFETMKQNWSTACYSQAKLFSTTVFIKKLQTYIDKNV